MTTYKVQKPYLLSSIFIFIFPLILTIINVTEVDGVQRNEWIGLIGFWALSVVLVLIPFGSKLEIGINYIKNYFLGFCTSTIKQENVVAMNYGNLFRGGLGYGKGLNIRVQKGFSKHYSIGEKLWGKEVIAHAQRVLENKENTS